MRYLFIPKAEAVTYLSCGQLIRNKNFLHPKRCLDSYVLIVIVDGSLNIVQDNTSYILGPNQFLLLHANTLHYGWQESADYLQYYWTHFHVPDDSFYITAPDSSTASYLQSVQANPDKYVLPETGTLKHSNRVLLLFSQLLDLSMRRYPVSDYLLRYFQTALLQFLKILIALWKSSEYRTGYCTIMPRLLPFLRLQKYFTIIPRICPVCTKRPQAFP